MSDGVKIKISDTSGSRKRSYQEELVSLKTNAKSQDFLNLMKWFSSITKNFFESQWFKFFSYYFSPIWKKNYVSSDIVWGLANHIQRVVLFLYTYAKYWQIVYE